MWVLWCSVSGSHISNIFIEFQYLCKAQYWPSLRPCTILTQQYLLYVHYMNYAVKCHYNSVQFIEILHTALHWQQQNMNQTYTHNRRTSYEVSVVRKLVKIDPILTHRTVYILFSFQVHSPASPSTKYNGKQPRRKYHIPVIQLERNIVKTNLVVVSPWPESILMA